MVFKIFSYLRSWIQWLIFGITTTTFLVLIFLGKFFLNAEGFEKILLAFATTMVRISGVRVFVEGMQFLDRKKTYIIMFNHFNFLDHFVLYHVLRMRVRGVEKADHFKWPVYGQLIKIIGIVPMPTRGATDKAIQALELTKERLKEGFSMLYAPEGTRSPDGNMGKFKKGGFYLAVQTGSDILPITLRGMYRFNQKGKIHLTPTQVEVIIHPPVSTAHLEDSQVTALRDEVKAIIASRAEGAT